MLEAFQQRQSAFEAKFQHDQEMIFKAHARTSKLFGLWVAEQLGFTGAEAEAYAEQVVIKDLEEPGFEDVLSKVREDLPEADDTELYKQLDLCAEQAHLEAADAS